MNDDTGELDWVKPGWPEPAVTWCAARLAERGEPIAGAAVTVRSNAWSTVLQVPTAAGPRFFKACAPSMAAEVTLLPLLSTFAPGLTPIVLAADTRLGYLLLEDGGELLRPIIKADRNLDHWRRILAAYAALQHAVAPATGELLRQGVRDRTLATLPMRYDELLDDIDALLIDMPDGMSADEYERLRACAPAFAADCAALAALGIPASIDHSDLHDGNVLRRADHYVIIDWGDACVGHPFMTLPVTLRSIAYHLELDAGDPALAGLRDGYLAAWSDFGAPDALQGAFVLARRISMINRALTWREALRHAPPEQRAADADAVPGWLLEYLAAVAG